MTIPSWSAGDTDLGELVSQVVDYAIIGLDVEGRVSSWNAGAAILKGYAAEEAIGLSHEVFYPDSARSSGHPRTLLARARTDGRVRDAGWRVRADGTEFWADVVITALRSTDGSLVGYAKVTRDLTEERRAALALERSETQFRTLVSQVVDYAIIGLDPEGRVTTWNDGAELLKGYSADAVLGSSFEIFYTPADRAAGLPGRLLAEAMTRGHVQDAGWRVRRDGTQFWADVVITALHDKQGRHTGFTKVTRDSTQAREMQRSREAFVAGFSHDLRSPLTAIKGYGELLEADSPSAEQARILTIMMRNADRALDMVERLVESMRIGSGHVSLATEPIWVRRLASALLSDLGTLLRDHELVLDEGDVQVVADPEALRRVLQNLVTNAAKYSPDGSRIDVTWTAVDGRVEIRVADRGRGIDPDDDLFVEFERGTRAEADGGYGLGLTVVRELVRRMEGRVDLRPRAGGGTVATVVLPGGPPH